MRNAAAYQMRRHPFIAGTVIIVFGPYILAFLAIFVALALAAFLLDAALTRR